MHWSTEEKGLERKRPTSRPSRVVPRPALRGPVDPAARWYVVIDSEFHGPLSRRTLAEVLAEHASDDDAPLWSAASVEEWTTMRAVPGLAAEVAMCRARRATRGCVKQAGELAPFVASSAEPCSTAETSTSGAVDIAAALRVMPRPAAPIHHARPPALPTANASVRSVPPPIPRPLSALGQDGRRPAWPWLGAGVVVGGLVVASFVVPIFAVRAPWWALDSALSPRSGDLSSVAAAATASSRLAIAAETTATRASTAIAEAPDPMADVHTLREHGQPAEVVRVETTLARAQPRAGAVTGERAAVRDEPEGRAAAEIAPSAPADPEPSPAAAPAQAAPRARAIEDLILAALPTEPGPARGSRAPEAPALRDAPTEADVVSALDAVREGVVACTPAHAVAGLRITFAGPSGRVSSAYVDGVFAGTPTGSCIARAVRRARVAPFSEPSFTLSYPYRL